MFSSITSYIGLISNQKYYLYSKVFHQVLSYFSTCNPIRHSKMCILDIILARLYDSDDKPFVTESNNVSKKHCTKDERNGTVSIPKISEQERVPKQKEMNENNNSMVSSGGILGITFVNMYSSAEVESLEYSGLESRPKKGK